MVAEVKLSFVGMEGDRLPDYPQPEKVLLNARYELVNVETPFIPWQADHDIKEAIDGFDCADMSVLNAVRKAFRDMRFYYEGTLYRSSLIQNVLFEVAFFIS